MLISNRPVIVILFIYFYCSVFYVVEYESVMHTHIAYMAYISLE